MQPDTERWAWQADGTIALAERALHLGRYPHCVFHCQQAEDKLLKAYWGERHSENLPPRSHDLAAIAKSAGILLSLEQAQCLDELYRQYTASRYANLDAEYTEEEAQRYHSISAEIFRWLRQQLN